MPIYEYECTHCHGKFDLLQKMNDVPVTRCQLCSKDTAVRLVSAPGFQLKGSGWYVTDFKNKPKGNDKDKKEAGSSASEKSEPSKTTAEAPAKAETKTTKTTAKGETN